MITVSLGDSLQTDTILSCPEHDLSGKYRSGDAAAALCPQSGNYKKKAQNSRFHGGAFLFTLSKNEIF